MDNPNINQIQNIIKKSGSKGISLSDIISKVFHSDEVSIQDQRAIAVCDLLDNLLEEEVVFFDLEKDLWTSRS